LSRTSPNPPNESVGSPPPGDPAFHYPPDLLNLLVDLIPRLCRSKSDVLLFFTGAGVGSKFTEDLAEQVRRDAASIWKATIAREVLTRLNAAGDACLRQRREILKRVNEWEDFSTCWEGDRLEAIGLLEQVRRVVGVHDAFTRMSKEREAERQARLAQERSRIAEVSARRGRLDGVQRRLSALFAMEDAQARGKALEGVLADLFKESGIRVREPFTLRGWSSQGIIEQIDGVVDLDGEIYLVEMKWLKEPVGPGDVSQQLVRLFSRAEARGIFISASRYTPAALENCRDALRSRVVVLCELDELVTLLERERDLRGLLLTKVQAAIVDRKPLVRPQD
jgi:hypothetical protein